VVLIASAAALAITVAVVAVAGLAAYRRWRDTTDNALRRDVVQPLPVASEPAERSPIEVLGRQPATEYTVTVSVTPPPQSTAVQLAIDPNFEAAAWQPIAGSADLELPFTVPNSGYNMIYARFRDADGSVGSASVAGVTVDPTYQQATSSADGPHEPSWIRPFSPTEMVVRIEAGRLARGAIEPYDLDNPADGDKIGNRRGWATVERDGTTYGTQVSKRTDAIRRPDRLIGEPLDGDRLVDGPWVLSSSQDSNYGEGATITEVAYQARPGASGFDADGDRIGEVVHELVLTLPAELRDGAEYRLAGPEPVAATVFVFSPDTMVSPAVRVNQVGFEPGDQPKLAFLAGWYDGIGFTATQPNQQPRFRVVDEATGEVAFEGTGQPPVERDEMGRGDLSGGPVVTLDFSPLARPGTYRVCVDRIGCSHRFEIDDGVWARLATTVARSTFHQRSGTELGPPYTSIVRPRPYHPADGATVEASTYSLLDAQSQTSNTDFAQLAAGRTGTLVAEAWGGHFDAGDWDRRINHLWYARAAAQLVMLFPQTFARLETNIPESGDAVPDLLDEALWTVDLYRRMQLPSGAIRGGIEASAHPPANATSWSDDLAVFAYAPDRFSSYVYAGVAAELSVALGPYDQARADELLTSALAAMSWAEDGESGPDEPAGSRAQEMVAEQRMVAAAAMLMATGEADWHDLFVETADFLADEDLYLSCHAHDRCDAAWLYLQADEMATDESIRAELRRRFVATADGIEAAATGTAYGWTVENPFVPLVWGLGSGGAPHTSGLLKAFALTGDQRYRAAAVRSASVALGANPQNRSLVTGVGTEPVRNPQINDTKFGGLPVWPGTPVYGRHQLNATADDSWVVDDVLTPAGAAPPPGELPYMWQWYDVDSVALFNEFTVHQSHAEALWTFGVLAATSAD
jgi:endoglucanase